MGQGKPCGAIAWIKDIPIAYIALPMAALTGIASCSLNATLSVSKEKLGDPVLAALLLYMSGVVVSVILFPSPAAALYSTRQNDRPEFKWWMCLSGVCGAAMGILVAYVASMIPLVLVTLSYNTGQILGSFAADHVGFLGCEKRSFNKMKLCSLIMFTAGLMLFSVKDDVLAFQIETLFLLGAGMLLTVQASINRRAAEALPYRVQAMGVQFLSGFVILSTLWTFRTVVKTKFEVTEHFPWYMFMIPICFCVPLLFSYFVFAPKVGMALFAMVVILSEVVCSLVMDSLHMFTSSDARSFSLYMGFGIAAAFVGTILTALEQLGSTRTSERADNGLKDKEHVGEHSDVCSTEAGESSVCDNSETASSRQRRPSLRFRDSFQRKTRETQHSTNLGERLQKRQDEECALTRNCIEGKGCNSTKRAIYEIV